MRGVTRAEDGNRPAWQRILPRWGKQALLSAIFREIHAIRGNFVSFISGDYGRPRFELLPANLHRNFRRIKNNLESPAIERNLKRARLP